MESSEPSTMAVEIDEEDKEGCRNMRSDEQESPNTKGKRQKRGSRKRTIFDTICSGLKSNEDYDFLKNCDKNDRLSVLCEEACWIVDANHPTSHRKRSKPTDIIKQDELKYPTHLHFKAAVSVRSDAKAMKCISDKLTKSQLQMYRKTCFGHFLSVDLTRFSGVFLHSMLLHEMKTPPVESGRNEMWFWVDNHAIRFGPMEFALITGLRFGKEKSVVSRTAVGHRFKSRFFPGSKCIRRDQLFDAFKEIDWSSQNDEDAVRMALLVFLHRVLLGAGKKNMISEKCLLLVDNLQAFNRYPWGNEAWALTYTSLSSAMKYKFDKHMKNLTEHTNYEVRGFSIAFQIWMYEALDVCRYAERMNHVCKIPRILNWKTSVLPAYGRSDLFISKTGRPPVSELEPTIEEMRHETVSRSIQYLETVEMGVDMSSCDDSSEAEISPLAIEHEPAISPLAIEHEPDVAIEAARVAKIEQKSEPLSVPPISSFNREQLENIFLGMLEQHKQQIQAQWGQEKQQMQDHWKHEKELMEEKYQNLASRMNKFDKGNPSQGCCDCKCKPNNIRDEEDLSHAEGSGGRQPELTTDHGTESAPAAQPTPSPRPTNPVKTEADSPSAEISIRFDHWMDSEVEETIDVEPVGLVGKEFFRSLLMDNNGLNNEHIDAYTSLLCKRQLSHKASVSQNWTAVPSSFFTAMADAVKEKQSVVACGEGFDWPSMFRALVGGYHKDYFKPWHLVDKVILPINIGGRHWMVGELELVQWELILHDDSSVDPTSDALLEEALTPLLHNIVEVLNAGGYWSSRRPPLYGAPPPWTRITNKAIPGRVFRPEDCGLFACKFIEHLASGRGVFRCGGDDDWSRFRRDICLGLWSAVPPPPL